MLINLAVSAGILKFHPQTHESNHNLWPYMDENILDLSKLGAYII